MVGMRKGKIIVVVTKLLEKEKIKSIVPLNGTGFAAMRTLTAGYLILLGMLMTDSYFSREKAYLMTATGRGHPGSI